MNFILFLKGALVGFSVAAPVGPVCILCIRQATAHGLKGGLLTGLAASISDIIYTALAAAGAMIFHKFMLSHAFWFYVLGGLFLLWVAYTINKTNVSSLKVEKGKRSLLGTFFSTIIITFMSPMTTLLFVAMLSGYGIFELTLTSSDIVALSLGAGCGAMSWWAIVSFVVAQIYHRKPEVTLKLEKKGPWRTIARLLWPSLKHSNTLNVFLIVNRLAAMGIASYGLFTFSKAFIL